MTYSENGDTITIEMSRDDYELLLLLLGIATGSCSRNPNRDMFWNSVDFVNRLNAANPRFTPYEIPEEFRLSHADRP